MATDDFKAAFARRTTEDLVRVSAYPDDYLPEAVAAAVAELQRRRVPADELDRLTAHVHAHAAAEGRRAASLRQTAHAVRRVADVFDATSAHADSPSRILLLLVIGNVGTGLYLIATGSFEFFAGRLGAYGFDSAVAFVTGLLNVFIAYLLHRRRPLGLHMSVFGAVAAVPVSVTSLYLSYRTWQAWHELEEVAHESVLDTLRPAPYYHHLVVAALSCGSLWVLHRADARAQFGSTEEDFRRVTFGGIAVGVVASATLRLFVG